MWKSQFLCILIIICISSTGCYDSPEEDNDKEDTSKRRTNNLYLVNITLNQSIDFEIIVPLMIDRANLEHKQVISELMDHLEYPENVQIEIVNTTYGDGLRIIGNDSSYIESYLDKDIRLSRLNLLNDTDGDGYILDEYNTVTHWIYINTTNLTAIDRIEIIGSVSRGSFSSMSRIEINYVKETGWITVEGDFGEGA